MPPQGGVHVCVTVTLLDGLVLARAVFHHSMRCGVFISAVRSLSTLAFQNSALLVQPTLH